PPGDLVPAELGIVLLGDAEMRAQDLHQEGEGRGPAVRRTARDDHRRVPAATALDELIAEPRFPDPVRAGDADDLRLAAQGARERRFEERGLGVAADEPRGAPAQRTRSERSA